MVVGASHVTRCFQVLKTVHMEANAELHSRQSHRETVSSKESPQIGEPGYWHKLTPIQRWLAGCLRA